MATRKEGSTNMLNEKCITEGCDLTYAVCKVGGRWKLLILCKLEDGKLRFGELNKLIPGVTERMLTLQLRELEKDGLLKRTVYAYRVGAGDHWSEWFQFTTASNTNKPFSFIYLGDAQNDIRSKWSRVIRRAFAHQPDARFIIHTGDLINRSNNDQEWGEWHYGGGFINGMIPSLPSPGNHEYVRDDKRKLILDPHWGVQYTLPGNGPKGLEESVYYVDYQNVRIISLDSQMIILDEASAKIQYEWLEKVHKEILNYKRKDGVDLSGTLYLPAGYDFKNKKKLPLLIWAYPREYKDKNTAGQTTANPKEFTYPSYGSFIYWVSKGYAVLDNAAFTIVGEGAQEPNDTFIEQLVANGAAAIDAVDNLGYIDRKKVAVGGHSYGAFMTAHLLSNSNLFAAGIARSGAYNRTLTPFGFQSEQRNF